MIEYISNVRNMQTNRILFNINMKFVYTDKLKEYMNKKDYHNIIVEVANSDSSDFQVSELHVHFVSDKQANLFIKRQGFHPYETDIGLVLLPNYRLEYEDTVVFDLRKVLFINLIKTSGISF